MNEVCWLFRHVVNLYILDESRPPVLVFSPITDLIFKLDAMSLDCKFSYLIINFVITLLYMLSIYSIPCQLFPFLFTSCPSSCLPPLPHAFPPFLMPSPPSSCLPPLPHAFLPFLMPSSPSSFLPPLPHAFLPFLLPSSPSSCLPPLPLTFLPFLLPSSPSTSLPLPTLL